MSQNAQRDLKGRLTKGHTANPNGRPTREREAAYLLIMKEVVDATKWRNLCVQAYLGARGLRTVQEDGAVKTIEDTSASASSRLSYLRWIGDYLLGRPLQPVLVEETSNGELTDHFMSMKAEERQAVLEAARVRSEEILAEARSLVNKTGEPVPNTGLDDAANSEL